MHAKPIVLAVLVAGAAVLSGQSPRQPAAATLDDLLAEIRGLRADLKKSANTTTEAQLLTARLSLQEQRIAVLANQRMTVLTKLTEETRQRMDAEAQLQRFSTIDAKNLPAELPRDQFDVMMNEFKRNVALHRDTELQLRAQEAQLSAELANEQGRWLDFNSRLDEIERSLR